MAPADATAAATSAVAATSDLNGSGKYFMPSLYAKRRASREENLSRMLRATRGAAVPDQASTQEGWCYFVPCVIGTLRSPSLVIMSSADVSGFTIFSM